MEVRVENLTRHFGRTRAVDGVSFSFPSGRIFGFVGPNGAGKTTTMRILATADEPTAGDAFLDGISVVEDPEKARHLVGFMPDYLPLHRDITVSEYLDFYARAYGLRHPRRQEALAGLEEFAGLATLRYKTIQSLSKGMKQRVSLARALVHDPPVLILDEPAAGLDPRARVELRELLKILAQQGKAILVSSHILSELSEIVDGAIIIEQGRIVRAGMMDEILSRDLPGRLVVIRTSRPPEELHKALLQMPGVKTARIAGRHVEAAVEGGEEVCQALLAELLRRGFPVVEFTQRRADLEELFMNVTKGDVQ
jgi:ABC-2 type transport system ATP-binding protein